VENTGKNTCLPLKVLLFSVILIIQACAPHVTKKKASYIEITPISCELASIELSKIDMLFGIRVTNLGDSDLKITRMEYEFYINDQFASSGEFIEQPVNIRKGSSRNLEKFIPVPEERQTESLKYALRERNGTYTLRLTYNLDITGDVEQKTELKLKIY